LVKKKAGLEKGGWSNSSARVTCEEEKALIMGRVKVGLIEKKWSVTAAAIQSVWRGGKREIRARERSHWGMSAFGGQTGSQEENENKEGKPA